MSIDQAKALLWFLPPRLVNALSPQIRCSGALLHLSASPQLRAMRRLLLEQPLEVTMCAKAVGVLNMFRAQRCG